MNRVELEGSVLLVNGVNVYNVTNGRRMTQIEVAKDSKMSIIAGHLKGVNEVEVIIIIQTKNTRDTTA